MPLSVSRALCLHFALVCDSQLNHVSIQPAPSKPEDSWESHHREGWKRGRHPRSHRPIGSVFCASPLASITWKLGRITVTPWALVKSPFPPPEPGKRVHFAVNLQKRLSTWKCEGQRTSDGSPSKMHSHFRKHPCLFPGRGADRNRLPCRHLRFINPCEAFPSRWLPATDTALPTFGAAVISLSGH